ncbi:enoyl-CoA hydratase/isomerase family protein [Streptomyces sp. PSAA01]|uniref:enoyl-CoA hydratase/isomerase family protein n=1 Tax=Streptomyces sp. PSAA01 TaxID=2912762 RepID=UPI001F2416C1|nr:enoyl-CoA hydratase/isomerase family protein [Streptomyces sp. PSAA01]MCG0286202.1 enoyl-CoA hydratase/isomerase family protein [Streptomyces sp. PSAA01]
MRIDDSRPPVARLTLDRPESRNCLDTGTVRELVSALDAAERMPDTSVLVVDAEGDDFCSGMDLKDPSPADWRPLLEDIEVLLSRVRSSPLVTVALVRGVATGGGVGLAAACDLVVAGPTAGFRMTEVLLGMVPALILPLVGARVGLRRAYALALLAQPVSGPEAVRIGLADVCGDEPDRELALVLRRLRAADGAAVRCLKQYALALADHDGPPPGLAWAVLDERLSDPGMRERLEWLQTGRSTS